MSKIDEVYRKISQLEEEYDYEEFDMLFDRMILEEKQERAINLANKKKYREKLKKQYNSNENYWVTEQESEDGKLYYKKCYNSGGRKLGKKLTTKKMRKSGILVDKKGATYRKVVPYNWYVY